MGSVKIELDDDLVEVLRRQGEHQPLERAAREMIVLELYRRAAISGGRAAELLGMDRFDFIRYASDLGIPFFDMTEEEWEAELRTIEKLVASRPSSPTPAP
jgi:predicted HTH domain antitoxin